MFDPTVAPPPAAAYAADDWRWNPTQPPARPRATSDYSQIATEHHTVLLGGIGSFTGDHDDPVRRFIALVDGLYDRHVNLICTAAAAPPPYTQKWASAFDPVAVGRISGAGHRGQAHRCGETDARERYSPAAA